MSPSNNPTAPTNEALVMEIQRLQRLVEAIDDALWRGKTTLAKYHAEAEIKNFAKPDALGKATF